MVQKPPRPQDLVLTEGEPVPPPQTVAAPEAKPAKKAEGDTGDIDPEMLREVKRLADRVGGLQRLKEVVDVLIRLPR